jgi:hypothetical protein
MKLLLGPGHGLIQSLFIVDAPFLDLSFRKGQGNTGSLAQDSHRLDEFDPFSPHDEIEDVSADIANPANPTLSCRIDLQTGPIVIMPGAVTDIVAPLPAQFRIAPNQVNDIVGLLDTVFGVSS